MREAILIFIFLGVACDSSSPSTDDSYLDLAIEAGFDQKINNPAFYLQLDSDLPKWFKSRVVELIKERTSLPFIELGEDENVDDIASGSIVFSIGPKAFYVREKFSETERNQLTHDGMALKIEQSNSVNWIIATGKGAEDLSQINRGALYAAYYALDLMGMAFFHPLKPLFRSTLRIPESQTIIKNPRWEDRGIHLHTMHPIELSEVLNGWGAGGYSDQASFEALIPLWRSFCEWAIANRQNYVQWVLLEGKEWKSFSRSTERQNRLKTLTTIAHDYGLSVGIDAGIALAQQNMWRLILEEGSLDDEFKQLHENIDYLMGAGFDVISTEIGKSEFTTADDQRMLAWINELARYTRDTYGKKADIKIHVSQGQKAESYLDPKTGEPVNYNFLPMFADPAVGVLPHTVQLYALDDPAPTYFNEDFNAILNFMRQEAGKRQVIFFPETAYWVSYDIDVPLFLPAYAHRRFHDLRLIATEEDNGAMGEGVYAGSHIDGQIIFSSGWEWGYWLNDLIAARAAYDPLLDIENEDEAFKKALKAITTHFPAIDDSLNALLFKIAKEEKDILIDGKVQGKTPTTIDKLSGMAYFEGWETFDDISNLLEYVPNAPKYQTQPKKLGLVDLRNPLGTDVDYESEVKPLLHEMEQIFLNHFQIVESLSIDDSHYLKTIFDEIKNGIEINAKRAIQLKDLYDYVDSKNILGIPTDAGRLALSRAQKALDRSIEIVSAQEKLYRMDAAYLGGWRTNPTSYSFMYLWTVKSLHYWWRDEGKAVETPISPCYLNIVNPSEVALGEGWVVDISDTIASVLGFLGIDSVADCLVVPETEPQYPQNGIRN